ncbi:hypothetical protein [Paenibacillus contaminans]|uniref:hypothetical protein n=1 Tax=Paenibacillus contaminans TaxID=450362 RepID=UPI001EE11E85|nr:hypothetical protein [Paenibacillus contaminans]
MTMINHINMADENGRVYCCLRNKVVSLDAKHRKTFCSGCKMYRGDAGGQGVECAWDDARGVSEPYTVSDPQGEWLNNQIRKVKPQLGMLPSSHDAWNSFMMTTVEETMPESG